MPGSLGEVDSPSGRRTARINQVDVTRPPLILEEDGRICKIYLHSDVPMRYHFMSQVDARCIVSKPGEATHILLDLLPPHDGSSAFPTEEDRGYIYHRGDRHVLCGYWAQECLRVGGVAETVFWDLSGWNDQADPAMSPGPSQSTPTTVVKVAEKAELVKSPRINHFQRPGPAAAAAAKAVIAKARKRELNMTSAPSTSTPGQKRKRASLASVQAAEGATDAVSSASIASEAMQEERDRRRRSRPALSVELKTIRKTRNSVQSTARAPSPAISIGSSSSSAPRTEFSEDKTPAESPTIKRRAINGPKRFLPKLAERSAEEIQEIWDYFIREIHLRLGAPIPENAKMGNVDTVKQWMLTRVHEMWCEARSKYSRRNLDHLNIMLSTWKTAREFNLSPFAFRKYYDDFHGRIVADKTPYLAVKDRPPNWPFHEATGQC